MSALIKCYSFEVREGVAIALGQSAHVKHAMRHVKVDVSDRGQYQRRGRAAATALAFKRTKNPLCLGAFKAHLQMGTASTKAAVCSMRDGLDTRAWSLI